MEGRKVFKTALPNLISLLRNGHCLGCLKAYANAVAVMGVTQLVSTADARKQESSARLAIRPGKAVVSIPQRTL